MTDIRYSDLSHPISPGMPVIPGQPSVTFRGITRIQDGASLNSSAITLSTHTGTHLDAPAHAIPGGLTVDQLAPSHLLGRCVIGEVSKGPGEQIVPADLVGIADRVEPGDWVFIRTGMDALYGQPAYFDHPYFSPAIVDWASERDIHGLGTDTLSPDAPPHRRTTTNDIPVHRGLLVRNILIIENLRGLWDLVNERVWVAIGVLGLRDLDGSPARVLAVRQPVRNQGENSLREREGTLGCS